MARGMKCAGALAMLVLLVTSTVMAKDYEIRLHRPAEVGEKYRFSVVGHHSARITATRGGLPAPGRTDEFSFWLEATATVLETDKKGQTTKLSLTITKCTKTKGDAKQSLVPRDTVIVGSVKNRKKLFEIDGKPVDQETYQILSSAVGLAVLETTDDEVFGTQERKSVGDSWDINAERAAEDVQMIMPGLRKADITGKVTLIRVVKVGETKCLELRCEMTIKKFSPPAPPGLTLEKGTLKATLTGKFPVNTSLGLLEESKNMTLTFLLKGRPDPNGPEMTVESTVAERVTSTSTYLK